MNFKKWLKLDEVGTSTSAVAVFARPVGGIHTRTWPPFVGEEPPKKKKKKKKRKKKRS